VSVGGSYGSTYTTSQRLPPSKLASQSKPSIGRSGYQSQLTGSQYGSDSYYSSAATNMSYSGSYDSSFAAPNKASSYTGPTGRGSYDSQCGGLYDSGYHSGVTSDAYDESGYYNETETNESYDDYNTGQYPPTSYRPSQTSYKPSPASYGPSSWSTDSRRPTVPTASKTGSFAAGKTGSSADQYYTASGKAESSYMGAGDYWSTEDENCYYGETDGGYGESTGGYTGYGESASGYDESAGYGDYGESAGEYGGYDNSSGGYGGYGGSAGGYDDYDTTLYSESGDDLNYPASSSNYQLMSSQTGTSWSGATAGRAAARPAYSMSQSLPTTSRSSSLYQESTAGGRGFQTGYGGRQTDFQTSSYGFMSTSAVSRSGSASQTSLSSSVTSGSGFQTGYGGRQTVSGGTGFQTSSYGLMSSSAVSRTGSTPQTSLSSSVSSGSGFQSGYGGRQTDFQASSYGFMSSSAVPRSGSMAQTTLSSSVSSGSGFQSGYGGRQTVPGGTGFQTSSYGFLSTSAASQSGSTLQTSLSSSASSGLGFQTGRGGRQTVPGGTGFQTSSYGFASTTNTGAAFSSAASGYVGGSGMSEGSQKTPRLDGFTSYVSGADNSSAGSKSARYGEPHSETAKRPSRWSDEKPGSSDRRDDSQRLTDRSQSSRDRGRSTTDTSTPQVFDYGHRDCDEEHAARSSNQPYFLANVKRGSSPSPGHRRSASSSAGSHWQTPTDDSLSASSRRDDRRDTSRSTVTGRSRGEYKGSVDTYDQRKSSSYSERLSSSSDRHSSSYGQSTFTRDQTRDRRSDAEPNTSSRGWNVGHGKERTSAGPTSITPSSRSATAASVSTHYRCSMM